VRFWLLSFWVPFVFLKMAGVRSRSGSFSIFATIVGDMGGWRFVEERHGIVFLHD
jgi:hypothetical protein